MNSRFNKLIILSGLMIFSATTFAVGKGMDRQDRGDRRDSPPFCVLDLDKDGSISLEEYTANRQKRGERRASPPLCVLDLNEDGLVTLEEFKKHVIRRGDHETIFTKIDTDGDKTISEQELINYKPQRKQRKYKRNKRQRS